MKAARRQELRWDAMDPGIRETVRILWENGIETTESCQGTRGHVYPEPTVCFDGTYEAGFRALALALAYGLHPNKLLRVWRMDGGELVGPEWRMTFRHPDGGGLHPVERNGVILFEWGRAPKSLPAPSTAHTLTSAEIQHRR
jgi:hypothetical protein